MPSIIFCYRILFGLQRKVSLGGGGSTLMSGGRGPFSLSGLPLPSPPPPRPEPSLLAVPDLAAPAALALPAALRLAAP